MLNLHELNVFIEAAQAENFSVAARRLYLSQPAVSLQMRNLERELGLELFERNGRSISLSEAGKVLLPLAQDLLSQSHHIEEVMWGLQGLVIGELPIACSTTVGKYILPQLIASFRKRCPEVRISVNVISRRAALDWLLENRARLAVVSTPTNHRDLESCPFLEDRVVLIVPASHPWAREQMIEPNDLLTAPFIMREPTAGTYEVMAKGLANRGLNIDDLKVVMTLGNAEAIEMSVEAGLGIAFVSHMVACRGLALGRIAEVPVRGLDLRRSIFMVRHSRRSPSPPQQAFWDFAFDPENEGYRQLPAI